MSIEQQETSPVDRARTRFASALKADLISSKSAAQSNLTQVIGPWINDAIEQHAHGETVRWETSMMPVEGPEGPTPVLFVFLWHPSAMLNGFLTGSFQITNPLRVDPVEVDEMISSLLHQMREARSQQLAAEQQQIVNQNGHQSQG